MRIVVNSTERDVPENCTVLALLGLLDLSNKRVAVEVNAELATRAEWANFALQAGDRVEVVSFVGGG
jgi:thiamine biosynthesis protein ThiS